MIYVREVSGAARQAVDLRGGLAGEMFRRRPADHAMHTGDENDLAFNGHGWILVREEEIVGLFLNGTLESSIPAAAIMTARLVW
jgi:hypothetical protein